MSDKEAIEGMQAISELVGLLKGGTVHAARVIGMIQESVEGNHLRYFDAVDYVAKMEQDDVLSALIVTSSVIARIKSFAKDTDCYQQIKDILDGKNMAGGN